MAEDLVVSGIKIETDELLSGRKTVEAALTQMEGAASKLDAAMRQASGGAKQLGEAQLRASLDAARAAHQADSLRTSWRQYGAETNAARVSLSGMTAAQKAAANPIYARSVAAVRDRLAEMRGNADRARQSTDRLATSTRNVGNSTGRLDGAITGATGSLRNMATGLLAVFGAAAIVNRALRNMENATRFIVSTNADFQQLTARLRAVTGSTAAARKAFGELEDFSRRTPFAVDQVTEAFIRMSQLGAEPSIEKMEGLANVAAFVGAEFGDLSNAIVSAVNTSVEPIRNFGASVTVQNDKLRVSFNGVTETIPRSVAALTDFFARAGQTGRVAGAAAEQMDTLTGRASGLRTSIISLARSMGDAGLNAELQDTIKWFDDLIRESDDLAVSLGSTAAQGVRALRGAIEDLLPIVQAAIGLMADLAGVASVPDFGGAIARQAGQSTDIAFLHDNRVALEKQIDQMRRQAADLRRSQEPIRIPVAPEVVNEGLGRAQSIFDLARKNIGRLPGVPDDVGAAARQADKDLSALDATIRELEQGLEGTKDAIDLIVNPPQQITLPPLGGGTGGRTKRTPVDEFKNAMEALAEGRREIAAMAAATAGTTIEFSAAEEEASLLEQTIRRLAALPEAYAAQVQAALPDIIEMWQTERREIRLTEQAEEQRQARLAVQRNNAAKQQEFLFEVQRRQNDMADELAREELRRQREIAEQITGSFADAFASIITGTESVSEAFQKMAKEIIDALVRIQIQRAIIEPLMKALFPSDFTGGIDLGGPGGGLPGFAAGGSISAGTVAVVGERGPELFVPSSSGSIVPSHRMQSSVPKIENHFTQVFEIRAIDSRDMVQALEQNAPVISRAVAREVERSAAMRRRFTR